MSKKVGIPRALFYYMLYPLWKTFFEEIGAEVVVSDCTTKKIMDDGVRSCVDEACLPVKVFHGHVISLKNRVDWLFIPRLTSISEREYICPKFGGLPDMVRNSLKDLPPIIDTEVNLRKSQHNAIKAALDTGRYFNASKGTVKRAFAKAMESHEQYRRRLCAGELPCDLLCQEKGKNRRSGDLSQRADMTGIYADTLNIAVIGHVYNLNDSYCNMEMIKKLRESGANIITIDMVDGSPSVRISQKLPKRMFWYFGRRASESAFKLIHREDIDGIIYVMSFGCGVDSFVCDLIERLFYRNSDKPFVRLTLDEHSGEGGMNTRLEAFMDMVRHRKYKKGVL